MSSVLDDLSTQPPPTPPPLAGDLAAELDRLEAVEPRRPRRQLAQLAGLAVVVAAGFVLVLGVRRDLGELPVWWIASVAVAWTLGFAVPGYFAIVPRAGSVVPRWRHAAIAAIVTSLVFVALGVALAQSGPSSGDFSARFWRGHTCLELGLASALLPVIIGALFLRGSVPVGSRWAAAALGAGSGCVGGFMLHFHCRIADGLHVGLVHGSVVIVSAALAAALVPHAPNR